MNSIAFAAQTLPGRGLFRVEGPDAGDFLHNLATADIAALAEGQSTYAALLTPQGKMLFDFFVLKLKDGFLVDCAVSQKADFIKRLALYKLRAQISIVDVADQFVAVSPGEPDAPIKFRDPRLKEMGWRFLARDPIPPSTNYDAARIAQGLADTDAELGSGEFFPHEANLDQLGAVSFSKGCYVGQEVVSRMEHRGTARSRILPVVLSGPSPAKGTAIRSGQTQIGSLLSSAGNRALALIRLDRLAGAEEPLLTENVSVAVLKPRFARYDVPNARDAA